MTPEEFTIFVRTAILFLIIGLVIGLCIVRKG